MMTRIGSGGPFAELRISSTEETVNLMRRLTRPYELSGEAYRPRPVEREFAPRIAGFYQLYWNYAAPRRDPLDWQFRRFRPAEAHLHKPGDVPDWSVRCCHRGGSALLSAESLGDATPAPAYRSAIRAISYDGEIPPSRLEVVRDSKTHESRSVNRRNSTACLRIPCSAPVTMGLSIEVCDAGSPLTSCP